MSKKLVVIALAVLGAFGVLAAVANRDPQVNS